jgi:homoserine dehydrogenase
MPIPIRIGLFGGGVVGGGVVELLQRPRIGALGLDIVVSKICVQSLEKQRYERPNPPN